MSSQEIKPEPLGEVEGAFEHLNERGEDFSNIVFDYEDPVPDQDKIPIKEEIKEEIKHEPMDIDNRDNDSHVIDVEKDQEKSYLQSMIDKLLIEKHTLQKDIDKLAELQVENQILKSEKSNVERQLEDKTKEFEELQVKNQNLTSEKINVERQLKEKVTKSDQLKVQNLNLRSEKNNVERQLHDKIKRFDELHVKNQHLKSDKKVVERQLEEKEKEFQDLSLHCAQLQSTILNLKENKNNNSKKLNKSDVTQNMEISELNEEEPTVFQAEEFKISDPMASSNCSDSGTTQITFEQSTIPYNDNDSSEENKKKEEAWLHLTDTSDREEDEDHFNKKSKSKEHFTSYGKRMPRSTRKDIRYDENESSHDDNISNMDNSHQNRRHILKKTNSKVTPHKKNQVKRKQVQNLKDLNKTADENGNVPCPECGKMLKTSSLKTHIEDRHTDSPG